MKLSTKNDVQDKLYLFIKYVVFLKLNFQLKGTIYIKIYSNPGSKFIINKPPYTGSYKNEKILQPSQEKSPRVGVNLES